MSCRSIQKQLSAYVDGQLGEKEIDTVLDHTQKCRVCNQLLNNFRKTQELFMASQIAHNPSADIWETLENRIRLDKLRNSARSSRFTWIQFLSVRYIPVKIRLGFVSALTMVAILIIATSLNHQLKKSTFIQEPGITSPISYPVTEINQKSINDKFVQNQLEEYFQMSNQILTEIVNFEKPDDLNKVDFSPEKSISKNLLDDTYLIKSSMKGTQYEYLDDLVSDLEMVLLDVSNLDDNKLTEEIEFLGEAITSKELCTKINLVKLRNETPPKKKKSTKFGA